jgi:hypothetical protein
MYINDFVEGAKDDDITKTEYERKRDIFIKHRCAIKEDSIQEKQKCINYAGKIYQGLEDESIIMNPEDNLSKAITITLHVIKDETDTKTLKSYIGSISYLLCQHGRALPFLNRINEIVTNETKGKFRLGEREKMEAIEALLHGSNQWNKKSEMLWYRLSDSPIIFVGTFFDISQIGLVTRKNGTWMHCAIHIPKKFSTLQ